MVYFHKGHIWYRWTYGIIHTPKVVNMARVTFRQPLCNKKCKSIVFLTSDEFFPVATLKCAELRNLVQNNLPYIRHRKA